MRLTVFGIFEDVWPVYSVERQIVAPSGVIENLIRKALKNVELSLFLGLSGYWMIEIPVIKASEELFVAIVLNEFFHDFAPQVFFNVTNGCFDTMTISVLLLITSITDKKSSSGMGLEADHFIVQLLG